MTPDEKRQRLFWLGYSIGKPWAKFYEAMRIILEDEMETRCNIRDWKAWKPTLPTCPFCGGESELKSYKDSHTEAYWLKCKAYCPGEQNHPTQEAAIEAYGRRA